MRFLKFLALTPVAALLVAFLFANREWVTIYFDPLGVSGLKPVQAPQFAALLAAMAVGVVIGHLSAWLGQARHRRAAREAKAEAARLRAELQRASPAASLARTV